MEGGAVSKRGADGGSKQCGRDVAGGGAEAGKKGSGCGRMREGGWLRAGAAGLEEGGRGEGGWAPEATTRCCSSSRPSTAGDGGRDMCTLESSQESLFFSNQESRVTFSQKQK